MFSFLLKYFNYDFNSLTKHEMLMINCNVKYEVYNDNIIN